KVAGAEFKLCQRIWPQSLDRASWSCRLLRKARLNRRLQSALVTDRKRAQVRLGFGSDRDLECHCAACSPSHRKTQPMVRCVEAAIPRHTSAPERSLPKPAPPRFIFNESAIPKANYLDQPDPVTNLIHVKLLERLDRACRLAHLARSARIQYARFSAVLICVLALTLRADD